MSYRSFSLIFMVSLAVFAPLVFAQLASAQRGGRGGAAPAAGSTAARPVDITAKNSFDMASVDRGGKIFAAQCASCHGANARGGLEVRMREKPNVRPGLSGRIEDADD